MESIPASLPDALPNANNNFNNVYANNTVTGSNPRGSSIIARAEPYVDELGERVKEDFLVFLQRCREGSDGSIGPLTSTPTSELLTTPLTFNNVTNNSAVNTAANDPPSMLPTTQPLTTSNLPMYVQQLHEMRNEGQTTLFVDFTHVLRFNDVLAMAILENYYRYL